MILTYEKLEDYVANLVTLAKLSLDGFSATKDNVVGLVDKIGKILTLDTDYRIDKLAKFSGEFLSFGKTVEEWQQDLEMPSDFDPTGANALSPAFPSYRPVFYSFTLGRKKAKTTVPYGNIERAVHNESQFVEVVSMIYKRLEDTVSQYRYAMKRDILGKIMKLAVDTMDPSNATAYAISTAFNVGDIVKNSNAIAIVFQKIEASNTKTYAQAKADGLVVELDLVTELAKPTDATSGEDFVTQLKKDVEVAGDISQGHSFNGNCLGATRGLTLITLQGVSPVVDVKTLAGAFHEDKVAIPCEMISVVDFGADAPEGAWAILIDNRAMRLHETYNATRENLNGDGDFMNIFRHFEHTGYFSRNTFVKVYVEPSE
jgi:hypothetical protein